MKTALLHESEGLRTFALVLTTGEEVMSAMTSFATEHQLRATQFTAIGALSRVVVAFFDWTTRQYRNIRVDEQVEVLSLLGDVTLDQSKPKVHAHIVLGKADASAHGGHLVEGLVRPTMEIIMTETPGYLRRRLDPESGLALIDATGIPARP
jgi:predicted DNA-binding protein with PD1-like motif